MCWVLVVTKEVDHSLPKGPTQKEARMDLGDLWVPQEKMERQRWTSQTACQKRWNSRRWRSILPMVPKNLRSWHSYFLARVVNIKLLKQSKDGRLESKVVWEMSTNDYQAQTASLWGSAHLGKPSWEIPSSSSIMWGPLSIIPKRSGAGASTQIWFRNSLYMHQMETTETSMSFQVCKPEIQGLAAHKLAHAVWKEKSTYSLLKLYSLLVG